MNIRTRDNTATSKPVSLSWRSPRCREGGIATEAYISKQMQEFMIATKLISDDRDSWA
jgi:hypothetical protein